MAETLSYIEMLQRAVEQAHGCKAEHDRTAHVEEVFQGQMAWVGDVEVFLLTGHPRAKRGYAWGHAMRDTGNEVRVVTVLGVPPVDSPRKAVQVSIVADTKAQKQAG